MNNMSSDQQRWSASTAAQSARPRVLIADDHTLVAQGLAKLVGDDFDVVGTAMNGRELIELARQLSPDIALIDIVMPELTGLEASQKLLEAVPGCKVIFVSMHSKAEFVREAFRAGASGYILKRSAASELVEAMREVMKGNAYLSPFIAKDVLSVLLLPHAPSLTARQREVLRLVADGRSAKEIADYLHISVKTAQFHKTSIMEKLGVHTTAELTRYALEHGIAS